MHFEPVVRPGPKGQESLAQGKPWYAFSASHAMPRSGLRTQPSGFNPGKPKNKRFALKGREERAIETYSNHTLLSSA